MENIFRNHKYKVENYQLSPNIPKPVHHHRSAVRAGTTGSPTHQSLTSWNRANCKMNLYMKMKKKMKGKKTAALKKKIVTVGEIFITGALLTAGGNMVVNLLVHLRQVLVKLIGYRTRAKP